MVTGAGPEAGRGGALLGAVWLFLDAFALRSWTVLKREEID